MERQFTEQELVRREKMEKIRSLGMDPFGSRFDRDSFAADLKEKYKDVEHEEFENMTDTSTVAGRIMFIRKMGKASFFSIKDKKKKQVVVADTNVDINSATIISQASVNNEVSTVQTPVNVVSTSNVSNNSTNTTNPSTVEELNNASVVNTSQTVSNTNVIETLEVQSNNTVINNVEQNTFDEAKTEDTNEDTKGI